MADRQANVIRLTANDAMNASMLGTAITTTSETEAERDTRSGVTSMSCIHIVDGDDTAVVHTPGPTGLIGQTVIFGVLDIFRAKEVCMGCGGDDALGIHSTNIIVTLSDTQWGIHLSLPT